MCVCVHVFQKPNVPGLPAFCVRVRPSLVGSRLLIASLLLSQRLLLHGSLSVATFGFNLPPRRARSLAISLAESAAVRCVLKKNVLDQLRYGSVAANAVGACKELRQLQSLTGTGSGAKQLAHYETASARERKRARRRRSAADRIAQRRWPGELNHLPSALLFLTAGTLRP